MDTGDNDNTKALQLGIDQKILHYQIISFVGAGGMGEVYLARDETLDRLVAIKTLLPQWAAQPQHRKKFLNEARASARLNHKNICSVFAIESTEDKVFISMEYVQGSTLKEIIIQDPIDIERVRDIAMQCCEGFQAAHEENILHRDIKSSNIMVDKYGNVKIMDFGLAKFLDDASSTQTGAIAGTFQYMSPEQITAKRLDSRSDIFSLGVVLYEALTGKLPFEGDNVASLAYSLVHGDYTPIREVRPDAPEALIAAVDRALIRDVDRRWQTASDLLAALKVGVTTSVAIAPPAVPAGAAIAVLPFRNLTRGEDDLYLSEGICEEVITSLAKMPQFSVSARSAVARFAKSDLDLDEIGKKLNVNYFVEGSIRRQGDVIRLNAQLTRLRDGMVIWSDSFERRLDNIFSLQADIAQQVTAALNLKLDGAKAPIIESRPEVDPIAYDLYLQAKFHLKRRDKDSVNKAIELLSQAIERDDRFAAAYGELAVAVALCTAYDYPYPERYRDKGEQLADRAIDLNAGSSQAHMSLFFLHRWTDIARGVSELRTAVALDPSNFEAYHLLAHSYMFTGLYRAAARAEQAAIQIDPFQEMADAHLCRIYFFTGEKTKLQNQLVELSRKYAQSYVTPATLGWLAWIKRDWSEALEHHQKALVLAPSNRWTLDHISDCQIRLGRPDAAMELLLKELRDQPDNYLLRTRLAQACRAIGETQQAEQHTAMARELAQTTAIKRNNRGSAINHFDLAWIEALSGQREVAFDHFKLAVEKGFGHYAELRVRPDWDLLKDSSEFVDLLASLEQKKKEQDKQTA